MRRDWAILLANVLTKPSVALNKVYRLLNVAVHWFHTRNRPREVRDDLVKHSYYSHLSVCISDSNLRATWWKNVHSIDVCPVYLTLLHCRRYWSWLRVDLYRAIELLDCCRLHYLSITNSNWRESLDSLMNVSHCRRDGELLVHERESIYPRERKIASSLSLFPFLIIFNLPVRLDVLISFCTVHLLVWQRRRTNAHRARVEDGSVGCPSMLVYWSNRRWMTVRWDSSSWPSSSQRNPSGLWAEQIHLTSFHDAYQSKQEETGFFDCSMWNTEASFPRAISF